MIETEKNQFWKNGNVLVTMKDIEEDLVLNPIIKCTNVTAF